MIPFAAIGAECPGKDQCFGSRHSGRISLSDVAHVADTCHGQNYGALPIGNGHQIYIRNNIEWMTINQISGFDHATYCLWSVKSDFL